MPITSRFAAAAARAYGMFRVAASAAVDPFFNYTTLLLPGNGTNGAQNNTFLDSSSNTFTITRNGNTTQGTFTPFSQTGWGNYFDGSASYLNAAENTAFVLGTGDFTIEAWIYITGSNTYKAIVSHAISGSNSGYVFQLLNNKLYWSEWFSSPVVGTTTLSLNTWYHVAACRSGTTLRTFINGTQDGSATVSTNYTTNTAGLSIGSQRTVDTTADFGGYISNVRITKGGALYTANFTPPTTPLTTTVSAGTVSILTCQSNRFVDNSSNAFTLTVNGTSSVQAFSPFAPTASYSASTVGGSGYFDGSGDYLAVGGSSNLAFGTGDFTVEGWFYPTTDSGSSTYRALYDSLGASAGTTTAIRIYYYNNTLMFTDYTIARISGGTPFLNGWNHFALSRSGTSTKLFLNGTQVGSTYTDSNNYVNGTSRPTIGGSGYSVGTEMFVGYLGDIRSLKGTALYTANFTPPTAPLTAIANTQLLLSATNGGITDATAKNDLETVGNAQISTTQSKFGGSSMSFDGTGDYLSGPTSALMAFGTGDFTVEGWVYFNSVSGTPVIFSSGTYNTSQFTLRVSSSKFQFYAGNGATVLVSGTTTLSTSTWYHFAVVRSSGTTKIYVNGTSEATDSTAFTYSPTGSFAVGEQIGNSGQLNGYIDDLRITKGVARYTANFTAPTAAFPLQ